jgi:hypothetical protein
METLLKGFTADVSVIELKLNADSYLNTRTTPAVQWYCHHVRFQLDDLEEYDGQICSASTNVAFVEGDIINITVKSVSKTLHTLGVNAVNPVQATYQDIQSPSPDQYVPSPTTRIITGTPGELALRYSLQYWANRHDATPELIFQYADQYKQYMLKNLS